MNREGSMSRQINVTRCYDVFCLPFEVSILLPGSIARACFPLGSIFAAREPRYKSSVGLRLGNRHSTLVVERVPLLVWVSKCWHRI